MVSKSQSAEPSSLPEDYAILLLHQQQLSLLRSRVGDVVPAVNSSDDMIMCQPVHSEACASGQQRLCIQLNSSQLVKFANKQDMWTPGVPTVQAQKPKGASVRVACVNCRNAKKGCGVDRPCARCVKLRLGGCEDAPTKREKPAFSSTGIGIGATIQYAEPTAGSSVAIYRAPGIDPLHMTPSIAEAMHGSMCLPDPHAERPSDIAQWTEAQRGTPISHIGAMGQAMYAYGHPGCQNRTAVTQSTIPSIAVPPPATGYPGPVDMEVFPYYSPEYGASQVNDGLPGNAQVECFGMYPSSQGSATNPPYAYVPLLSQQ